MKSLRWLILLLILFLFACQPNIPQRITIIDGDMIRDVSTSARTPLLILTEAGITPTPADRVFVNGIPFALDQSITTKGSIQLQLRRVVSVTLNTPQGERTLQTSALTVGQALSEAGFSPSINDLINPPAETALIGATTVTYSPARDLVITTGEEILNIRSAAGTIGAALAEA
ncbi:MAG: DUF348 domain-containing protein, partial [Anaerolineales bacterium]|nr:DUF348 domain-containing protein [Anaerolineales bacterium]